MLARRHQLSATLCGAGIKATGNAGGDTSQVDNTSQEAGKDRAGLDGDPKEMALAKAMQENAALKQRLDAAISEQSPAQQMLKMEEEFNRKIEEMKEAMVAKEAGTVPAVVDADAHKDNNREQRPLQRVKSAQWIGAGMKGQLEVELSPSPSPSPSPSAQWIGAGMKGQLEALAKAGLP